MDILDFFLRAERNCGIEGLDSVPFECEMFFHVGKKRKSMQPSRSPSTVSSNLTPVLESQEFWLGSIHVLFFSRWRGGLRYVILTRARFKISL